MNNGISVMGGNRLDEEHYDDEDMTVMGWDVRMK